MNDFVVRSMFIHLLLNLARVKFAVHLFIAIRKIGQFTKKQKGIYILHLPLTHKSNYFIRCEKSKSQLYFFKFNYNT